MVGMSTEESPQTASTTEPTASEQPEQAGDAGRRAVTIERVDTTHYRATNAAGATVDFGRGEGLLSPVELLLAATAGCSAVDVDVVTSRRSRPEEFTVAASAQKYTDEEGGSRLRDVELTFRVRFPDDAAGRKAQALVPRLVALSHEKDCTVSRTVQHPTEVTSRIDED